jgi:hypothetical protein
VDFSGVLELKDLLINLVLPMKQTLMGILLLLILAGLVYWALMQNAAQEPAEEPGDETTELPAEPAADDVAAVPAEPTADDYVGLSEAEAEALAAANEVPFRVVERDGEMLMVTEDWRPGRINAVVKNGTVVSYTVEGSDVPPTDMDKGEPAADAGTHDAIIGMTVAEAEAYAAENEVPFRIGSVDGEARPVTMDYRPGRITASVVDGLVTDYSVE